MARTKTVTSSTVGRSSAVKVNFKDKTMVVVCDFCGHEYEAPIADHHIRTDKPRDKQYLGMSKHKCSKTPDASTDVFNEEVT